MTDRKDLLSTKVLDLLMRGREVTSGGPTPRGSDLSVSGSLSLQSERAVLAARHAADGFHVTQDEDWGGGW